MTTKLDELLGKELAGKLSEALGLGSDKDKSDDVLHRMHELEVQFLMDSLHDSPGGETVSDVYHRALLLALAKTATDEVHTKELEYDLAEAHDNARYAVNARDNLQYEVTNLRYQVEDIAPYRALVSRLAIYIAATPGTLNAFMPDVAAEVDEYLVSGSKPGQMSPKLEAITTIRKALHCGLKEAKDLVEARMAMHESDRIFGLEEKGIAVEKLVPIGKGIEPKNAAQEAWDKKFGKDNMPQA